MSEEVWQQTLRANPADRAALERAHHDLIEIPARRQELADIMFRGVQADRHNDVAIGSLALVAERAGDFREAVKWACHLIAVTPASTKGHFILLARLRDNTHAMMARARYHGHIAEILVPDWFEAVFVSAHMAEGVGPAEEAVRLWRRCVELRPDFATAHLNLAQYLAVEGMDIDEATHHLERAIELDPTVLTSASAELLALKANRATKQRKPIVARYPRKDEMTGDIKAVIRKHVLAEFANFPKFLRKDSKVFTMGSCFARNIGRTFRDLGYEVFVWEFADDINSTFANAALMRWLDGKTTDDMGKRIEAFLGPKVDRKKLEDAIAESDLFVLTLGVAPVFFDRATGDFVMPQGTALNTRALAELYEFRTTSVEDNLNNMIEIYHAIRRRNTKAKIFVTVSPVPLRVTFEMPSALMADCVSKSTLRVTANELVRKGLPDLHYWPAFDIIRWLSGHVGPFFGTDDDYSIHISEKLILDITGLFVETFAEPSES